MQFFASYSNDMRFLSYWKIITSPYRIIQKIWHSSGNNQEIGWKCIKTDIIWKWKEIWTHSPLHVIQMTCGFLSYTRTAFLEKIGFSYFHRKCWMWDQKQNKWIFKQLIYHFSPRHNFFWIDIKKCLEMISYTYVKFAGM